MQVHSSIQARLLRAPQHSEHPAKCPPPTLDWQGRLYRAAVQIVYEFLLRYVVSNDTDAKTAKKYIDQFFVVSAQAA